MCPCKQMNGNYMLFLTLLNASFGLARFLFTKMFSITREGRLDPRERSKSGLNRQSMFSSLPLYFITIIFQILTLGYFDTDSEIFKLHSPTVSYKLQYVLLQRSSKSLSRHLLDRKSISTPCCFIYSIWV